MASSYFSHDSNARNSKKLIRLRQQHGAAGYGVYFMILERLREEGGYTSDRDYDMIAYDLRESTDLIRSVVEDFDLFELSSDGKQFRSKGLLERMNLRDIRSAAGKKGASGRWDRPQPTNSKTDGKNSKKTEKRKIKNDDKNSENDMKKDENNPSQNGSQWQNDSKNDVLLMALNKIKVKKKEIKNKEKSIFLKLELATYMAFTLHVASPADEADKLIAYNTIHNKQSSDWDTDQWFAAAQLWKAHAKKEDTRYKDDEQWFDFWLHIYGALCEHDEYELMLQALSNKIKPGTANADKSYTLCVTDDLYEWIERNLDELEPFINNLCAAKGCNKNLYYTIV